MWHGLIRYLNSRVSRVAVVASVLLLTGCASTLSARVTTYQQWPANVQGQTYRLVPNAEQRNNLEYQTFADMVRAAIGPTGLVEANAGAKARFNVSLEYGTQITQAWVQEYNDPFFYNGFGPGFGPFGGYYGRGGWGGGGSLFYSPSVTTVPVQIYKNSLTVIFKDNEQQGAEVYRSTAVIGGSNDTISVVMPYLSRAVFDGFPGNNGQTRDITFERRK